MRAAAHCWLFPYAPGKLGLDPQTLLVTQGPSTVQSPSTPGFGVDAGVGGDAGPVAGRV